MQRVSRVIVFTDLDGSLLDHDTYSFDPAVRTLEKLKDAGIPVIFAGSRTRIEIEWLQHKTGICGPFIAENGAAVFVPDGCFHFSFESSREAGGYRVLEFGWPYPEVVDALRETVAKLGVRVLAFSDLSASEVADLCGLPLWQAQMAKRREYDEPFRVLDPSPAAKSRLLRHLRVRGLHSIRTERFDHLTGVVDKGLAVATLRSWYERELNGRVLTIGLGDSLNDLPDCSERSPRHGSPKAMARRVGQRLSMRDSLFFQRPPRRQRAALNSLCSRVPLQSAAPPSSVPSPRLRWPSPFSPGVPGWSGGARTAHSGWV
jgi:mannosyl-3-phosphoglycerate phosphatase